MPEDHTENGGREIASLNPLHPEAETKALDTTEFGPLLEEYEQIRGTIDSAEKRKQALRNRLLTAMGNAPRGTCGSDWKVSCSDTTREYVDAKGLASAYPDLAAAYTRQSKPIRSVRVTPTRKTNGTETTTETED